ncbi:hypothetical protein CEXT_350231 [Caerostris extrusa]|uniref:Protein Wnt n=1 Tax=Caerostris extrusa TaxID=172846 RepID=A0AAV4Y2S0_CAEEX|nr:hypothetical protein CEXT_350231 [Caerostris extrusa]
MRNRTSISGLIPEDDFLRPMGQPCICSTVGALSGVGLAQTKDRKTEHSLQDSVKGYSEGITCRCMLGNICNAKVVWKIYVFRRRFF